jgi:hypothetical protein
MTALHSEMVGGCFRKAPLKVMRSLNFLQDLSSGFYPERVEITSTESICSIVPLTVTDAFNYNIFQFDFLPAGNPLSRCATWTQSGCNQGCGHGPLGNVVFV